MRRRPDLSVEGIFRKNGNIRRLNLLTEAIDRDPESVNLADDNPVQIAALLKKFLRDLPDPLLTFRLQHLWLATQSMFRAASFVWTMLISRILRHWKRQGPTEGLAPCVLFDAQASSGRDGSPLCLPEMGRLLFPY